MKDTNTLIGKVEKLEAGYELIVEELDGGNSLLDLKNKKLNDALVDQLELERVILPMLSEAEALFNELELISDDKYSDAMSGTITDAYKDYSITQAKEMAKASKGYQEARKNTIKAKALRDHIKGLNEIITSRRYILNNLTNAYVAGVERNII